MPFKDLETHLALHCEKNEMECFMKGCDARLAKKDMPDHLENACEHFILPCHSWPENWIDGDPEPEPRFCLSRSYCKRDEVHVTEYHVENPPVTRKGQTSSHQREGLEEGNSFERLTAQSLAGLASLDPDERAQAEMKFVEHTLVQTHLVPERFLCPCCGEDLDVGDDAEEALADHLRLECPRHEVPCPYCENDVAMKDMVQHVTKACTKALKACASCNASILRKDEAHHVAFECEKMKSRQCFLCFATLDAKEEFSHYESCQGQDTTFVCSEWGCFFRNDKTGCTKRLKLTEVVQHWLSECPEVKIRCGLCKKKLSASQRTGHVSSCPGLEVYCPYCEKRLEASPTENDELDWTTVVLSHCFGSCHVDGALQSHPGQIYHRT